MPRTMIAGVRNGEINENRWNVIIMESSLIYGCNKAANRAATAVRDDDQWG